MLWRIRRMLRLEFASQNFQVQMLKASQSGQKTTTVHCLNLALGKIREWWRSKTKHESILALPTTNIFVFMASFCPSSSSDHHWRPRRFLCTRSVACSSADAWAPVLGCSEAPEKSCNCLSLGKFRKRMHLNDPQRVLRMLNDLLMGSHSVLQPTAIGRQTSCAQLSPHHRDSEICFPSPLRPWTPEFYLWLRWLGHIRTCYHPRLGSIEISTSYDQLAIWYSASLPIDSPSLFWANSIWTGYELGLHLRELSPVGSRQICGSLMSVMSEKLCITVL